MMSMCKSPRFLPKRIIVDKKKEMYLWMSREDGRIYTDCRECNGKICGRGPERKEKIKKILSRL